MSITCNFSKNESNLNDWFKSPQGHAVFQEESQWIMPLLSQQFGYHALQIGLMDFPLLRDCRMPHCFYMSGARMEANVLGVPEYLPFENQSLDLILMPHTLDFSDAPHQVLREVHRTLIPGGRVILTGFNPLSVWGGYRLLKQKKGMPWSGHFLALTRIKDWLALLEMELIGGRFLFYRFPCQHPSIVKETSQKHWLDAAGDRWWPIGGAVYGLVAVKCVPNMKRIRPTWSLLSGKPLWTPVPYPAKEPSGHLKHD